MGPLNISVSVLQTENVSGSDSLCTKVCGCRIPEQKKETGSKRKQLPLPSLYRFFSDVIIETLETLESETHLFPTFCLNLGLTSVYTHKPKPSVQD